MDSLARTPLFAFHLEAGARMVPFAGWEMPVQYAGILEEHRAVRSAAGLFDVSHMGEARIEGPDALAFLNFLLTNDLRRLALGQGLYTVMCREDGGVVDDLIVYRTAGHAFLAVLNASNREKDVAWMREHAEGFDVTITDQSDDYALLALQGPASTAILAAMGAEGAVLDLPRFHLCAATVGGFALEIARTGYTGEDGFEIFIAPPDAIPFARALLAAGAEHGLVPVGLGARDSLRLEAGYPLYGHELTDTISPLEAGLGWVVKAAKPAPFLGQSVLAAQLAAGPPRRLVWYRLPDRRIAREGATVFNGESAVGQVTSGSLSPSLQRGIGAALIEASIPSDAVLEVDLRGKRLPLEIDRPPLHLPR